MNSIQQKILEIYKGSGYKLPPFRELAKAVGVSSTNTVAYHVNKLKENGYLGIARTENGVVKLNLKNLLELNLKSGVYVLLQNLPAGRQEPFYIGEAENIKKHLLDNVIKSEGKGLDEIEKDPDGISIAYYFLNNPEERENLKIYLIELYSQKGFKLK